ncbi:hypothetical protein [Musicola paradisiaca]|uniref:hypothetical protein n=1 Tax=Musicola paradisiaca TaxID=69223 RepID=UPI000B20A05B|nr:hypothetical protein [Musicola paradisiaca]
MKQDNALGRIAASKKITAEGKRIVNIATFSNFNHKALNDLITFNLNELGCYPSFYDGLYSDYFPHVLGNAADIKTFGAQFHFYTLDTSFIENDIGALLPTAEIGEKIQEQKKPAGVSAEFFWRRLWRSRRAEHYPYRRVATQTDYRAGSTRGTEATDRRV